MANAIPVFEVEFDKHGSIFSDSQVKTALDAYAQRQVTDLLVFSHGWNNDIADARRQYGLFFETLAEVREKRHRPQLDARKFAALALLWPSKRFTDEELIPSGDAASVEDDGLEALLQEELDELRVDPLRLGEETPADIGQSAALDDAKALVNRLEVDQDAQHKFVEAIRSTMDRGAAHAEDGSDEFFSRDPVELLDSLSRPVIAPPPTGQGGGALSLDADTGAATGQAAGVRDLFTGIKSGARRLLNFTTYYKMKERAGVVGRGGVADVLRQVRQHLPDVKLHLIGHSFGGRLVTAAVDSLGPDVRTDSLVLLQAAYSHNGLAAKFDDVHDGSFVNVVSAQKVRGAIVITHTKNDKAVGIAYPLASRVAFDNAAAFGDANDPYGGMGRNGAQHTPVDASELTLRPVAQRYSLRRGTIYNLNSDDFIKDHSDICGEEVAHLTLSAIAVS